MGWASYSEPWGPEAYILFTAVLQQCADNQRKLGIGLSSCNRTNASGSGSPQPRNSYPKLCRLLRDLLLWSCLECTSWVDRHSAGSFSLPFSTQRNTKEGLDVKLQFCWMQMPCTACRIWTPGISDRHYLELGPAKLCLEAYKQQPVNLRRQKRCWLKSPLVKGGASRSPCGSSPTCIGTINYAVEWTVQNKSNHAQIALFIQVIESSFCWCGIWGDIALSTG